MRKSFEYFLVLAKTLHFTQAANRLFITQQALSDQIFRLEKELKVQLFVRKPKLKLTPAGLILERNLYNLRRLEENLSLELNELADSSVGNIRLGIHTVRARILMPTVLARFHQRYPRVSVQIISDQTQNYKKMIAEGAIDFFFGINAWVGGELQSEMITHEPMYVVICQAALRAALGDGYPALLPGLKKGADLSAFLKTPFIFAADISQGQQCINRYLARKGLELKAPLEFNDYSAQYPLVKLFQGACFCPKMIVTLIQSYNASQTEGEKLYAFPIKDFQEDLELSIISYRDDFFPAYSQYMYDLLRDVSADLMLQCENML